MARFLIRRGAQSLITLVVASIAIFGVIRLAPGDPVRAYAGFDATPAAIQTIRHQFGFDRPTVVQYLDWIGGLFRGNLGISITTHTSVWSVIRPAVTPTLMMMAGSIVVLLIVGFGIGVAAAATSSRKIDAILSGLAGLLTGAPVFWTGMLAILLFAVSVHLLPVGGYVSPATNLGDCIKSMLLPCSILGLALGGLLARFVRTAFLDALQADYVRLARAKGASNARVMTRHVTRNALIPVVTVFGVIVATLLGGSVVVETVFAWPGMGRVMMGSVSAEDYPVVQAVLLMYVTSFIVLNFLTDISYSVIDARIKQS